MADYDLLLKTLTKFRLEELKKQRLKSIAI